MFSRLKSKMSLGLSAILLASSIGLPAMAQSEPPAPPAPGASPRIDAIRKAGALRVAVLSNAPWLIENTTGSGEQWAGPNWALAKAYARLLGVKLQTVPVSHETKIPVLAANQADMSITALAETPERLQVVDFVLYSNTSVCMFGRADNPKIAKAAKVDDLNDPAYVIAYFTGGAEEAWVKERFPKAQLRGVTSSSAAAPIEEIMARRADAVAINRIPWVSLNKKVKGLKVLPQENNCQNSTEKAAPVGIAVDKGQTAYLEWLRTVAKAMESNLAAEEQRVVESMP
jgi:polar amino acid transport system substrate-binding protein